MDTVAAEKATAMHRYRQIKKLTTALRCLEAVAAILLLSWLSTHLPAATRVAADTLRKLFSILVSHGFVFILGNSIVLLLVAKSGCLSSSADTATSSPSSDDPYAQFTDSHTQLPADPPPAPEPSQENSLAPELPPETSPAPEILPDKSPEKEGERVWRRSKSERRRRGKLEKELRRTVTEVKVVAVGPEAEEEDGEEFRRTVEAFIEKRNMFWREETMAIVCSSGTLERGDYVVVN